MKLLTQGLIRCANDLRRRIARYFEIVVMGMDTRHEKRSRLGKLTGKRRIINDMDELDQIVRQHFAGIVTLLS